MISLAIRAARRQRRYSDAEGLPSRSHCRVFDGCVGLPVDANDGAEVANSQEAFARLENLFRLLRAFCI